jgi:hypothetical protein
MNASVVPVLVNVPEKPTVCPGSAYRSDDVKLKSILAA